MAQNPKRQRDGRSNAPSPQTGKLQDGNDSDFIPHRKSYIELLKKDGANFSLAFPRLMSWNISGNTIDKPNDAIEKLFKIGEKSLNNITENLVNIHKRQGAVLGFAKESGLTAFELSAKTTAPFISGLGSGQPNETGMILDRNTGCPYIPASSIKGVLRMAYALKLAKDASSVVNGNIIDDAKLRKYFGDTDAKENNSTPKEKRIGGQLVLLDAFPESAPDIKLDIMNPHYTKYYSGESTNGPVETEAPVPIKFITVDTGCTFVFRWFFMPLLGNNSKDCHFDDSDVECVNDIFEIAFTKLGFGGKTAIGYGRFKLQDPEPIKKDSLETKAPAKPEPTPETGKVYQVKLIKRTKKEKWRCKIVKTPELEGREGLIDNPGAFPNKKAGDTVEVQFVEISKSGDDSCIFKLIEDAK